MIKEWATVIAWDNGLAQVSCDVKASCNSCASRAGCGSRVLNKLGPQTTHTITVPSAEPLVAGKRSSWALPKAACWVPRCWYICLRCSVCLWSRRYFRCCSAPISPRCVVRCWAVSVDFLLRKGFHHALPRGKPGSRSSSAWGFPRPDSHGIFI